MFRTLRRIAAACAFVCLTIVVAAGAQQGPVSPDEPVAVDFFAVGPAGAVLDLRPEEVSIRVDGKARRIRSLRYVALSTPSDDPSVEPRPDLEPPFGTNALAPHTRWVTIIVDHESVRAGSERNAINAAVRYIKMLGPRDRVSFVVMPNGGVEIDFTANHQQVIEALRGFVARAPLDASVQDRSCRSRLLLNTLRDYISGLATLQGPKSIVLLSSGVLNPRRDAPMNAPPGPCEIRQVYFQEVSTATSAARAHLYVVQPDDLKMDSPRQVFTDPTASRFAGADEDRAGLESLAGVSGGDFMRIVGPDDQTLTNLARGLTGYYIATIDVSGSERNGAMHRVDIGISRQQVRVRTNPEVLIPRAGGSTRASPVSMLKSGVTYRALQIRVSAFSSAGENGIVKILSVLEPIEPDVKVSDAMFWLIDARGQVVAQWTANNRELAMSPVLTAGAGPPGAYRLRVAAIDTNGRRGTTEFAFMARLTGAAPLTLSDIALGVSRDGSFAPKLVFGNDQAAVAYFEIYGRAPKSDSVSVRLEVAEGADSRALATAVPRVVAQGDDRRIAVGALAIAALAPGDYVVRAIVSIDGRPVGRVLRTLRKSPLGY